MKKKERTISVEKGPGKGGEGPTGRSAADRGCAESLRHGLEDLGWQVCCCWAETDPCIATECHNHQGKGPAVVSTDSDYLAYVGVPALLRPNHKGSGLLRNIESRRSSDSYRARS